MKNTRDNTKWLQQEIVVQEKQFQDFIDQLPKNIYAAKYLQIRKLVTDMSPNRQNVIPNGYHSTKQGLKA